MLLTTSRRTSQRTRTFCRELASLFPLCEYCNRGKKGVRELLDEALMHGHTRVLVVQTRDGNPSSFGLLMPEKGLEWVDEVPITARTRRDLGISQRVMPLMEDGIVAVEDRVGDRRSGRIAALFGAALEASEGDTVMVLEPCEKGVRISFVRPDISEEPVGPQITAVLAP
ncbi:MAG: hypothetical protein PHW58_03045 [Candidatus Methanofastidiosa archaeon]|nr:hypothetical protein [Candidatus Methanofastidiosa archaeon]